MALPQGRLWAGVLLLGLALAAAQTASALPPQPPSSSRPKPLPKPTAEEQWDKATRGLKCPSHCHLSLSPPSGKVRDWYGQVVRKWQPAPQGPLTVYKPALPAVRGLKAVTLSPQPEPPVSHGQQVQRVPRLKAPVGSSGVYCPLPGGPCFSATGATTNITRIPEWDPVDNKLSKSFRPPPTETQGFSGGGVPGTGDREGGYYDACGAGTQFKTVDCSSWSSAPDLASYGRQTSTGVCDKNYIECGSGGEGRKRETYHIEVSDVHGQRSKDGKAAYYARARIVVGWKTQPAHQYCWKRVGAGRDGCGCVCAVALKGSALGRRPECRCEAE
jgi:hypothetical protein